MTAVEVCLDDLDGVLAAEHAGADRVELCASLGDGGTTPSIGTISVALRTATRIGINVLVRQRAGDFVYSTAEVEAMVADIRAVRELPNPAGVPLGFVIGALRPDGTIDSSSLERMIDACGEHPVTFHKAFDQTPDLLAALDVLIRAGVGRILTSGGAVTAPDGADRLAQLVTRAAGRIVILAGGGVRPSNVADLVRRTGVAEVHLRAGAAVPSAALPTVADTPSAYDSGVRIATSEAIVAELINALAGGAAA
ncbi:copper homeostasis protein CutC [Leifsonia poae]|uniref:copper homeostasis protein CutC n=1 Tax=Leifsonia poae TaxID=110933 RepID=UPI001CBB4A93|nr:copper homeostasis protein CutC [Leifsonia poae]